MKKNTASQKWIVFAFTPADGLPVTGDAANITANLRLDGGAANGVDDMNPAELEDGYYVFDLTQAETNADLIVICPASSSSGVVVIGVPGAVWTTAAGEGGSTPEEIAAAVRDVSNATPAAGSLGLAVNQVKARTELIPDSPAAVGSVMAFSGASGVSSRAVLGTPQVPTDMVSAPNACVMGNNGCWYIMNFGVEQGGGSPQPPGLLGYSITEYDPRTDVARVVAGLPGTMGDVDGPSGTSRLGNLCSAVADATGIFFCEWSAGKIKHMTYPGTNLGADPAVVSTITNISQPNGINMYSNGDLLVAQFNGLLIHVARAGYAQTELGTISGAANIALVSDTEGYATDFIDSRIYRVVLDGLNAATVTVWAGSSPGYQDGTRAAAKFASPNGIVYDAARSCLYVCEAGGPASEWAETIREISLVEDKVTTLVGISGHSHPTDGPFGVASFGGLSVAALSKDRRTLGVCEYLAQVFSLVSLGDCDGGAVDVRSLGSAFNGVWLYDRMRNDLPVYTRRTYLDSTYQRVAYSYNLTLDRWEVTSDDYLTLHAYRPGSDPLTGVIYDSADVELPLCHIDDHRKVPKYDTAVALTPQQIKYEMENGDDSMIRSIKERTDNLPDDPAGWGAGSGTGTDTVTLTINNGLGAPIPGCLVWITSDQAGTVTIAGPLVTNDSGRVVFMLTHGLNYYCWRRKAGTNFSTNPVLFTAERD